MGIRCIEANPLRFPWPEPLAETAHTRPQTPKLCWQDAAGNVILKLPARFRLLEPLTPRFLGDIPMSRMLHARFSKLVVGWVFGLTVAICSTPSVCPGPARQDHARDDRVN